MGHMYMRLLLLLFSVLVSVSLCFPQIIHLFWTTPRETFHERHLKVLESYLFHHPSWEVRFYSRYHNDFQDIFSRLQSRGYNTTLIDLNEQFLDEIASRIAEAKVWLDERLQWSRVSPYYLGHLVDLLKPSILYLHGGIYSDLDALLLKPLPVDQWLNQAVDSQHNGGRCFAGQDLAFLKRRTDDECRWCLGAGKNVYISSGVIGAEPGSPIMKEALRLGFGKDRYVPESFNQCGPKSFTLAMKRYPTKSVALAKPAFYPFNYEEAWRLFSKQKDLHLDEMIRETWSMHFFGGTTAKLAVEEGSVLGEAMGRFGLESTGLKTSDYLELNGYERAIGSRIRAFNTTIVNLEISNGGLIKSGGCESNILELKAPNEASLNVLLSECQINCPSECTLSITTDVGRKDLMVFDINSVVTIIIKTIGRMEKVIELVDSIRLYYPSVKILVGDDGPDALRLGAGEKRGFEYVPFEYDIGLSEGRNRLVELVKTPYVQFLDDDFVFTKASDLGGLLFGLANFDIVGGRSLGDEADFSGRLRVVWGNVNGERKRKLLVKPAVRKSGGFGPYQVDIVPNLFMTQTELLKERIRWDPALKLGEHEDFFLRARQKGIKVASHPQVSFAHHQVLAPSEAYKTLRDRWHRFAEKMLRKHDFGELVSFGKSEIVLNPLGKAQIKRLSTRLMMPFAAQIDWEPLRPFYQYKVQLIKDNRVLSEVLTPFYGQTFKDLEPNTKYQFKVFAGNHTDFSTNSPVLSLETPSFFRKNLVKNPHFDGTTRSWKCSLGTVMALMPLYFPDLDANLQNMLCSGAYKEHLIGRPSLWAFRNSASHLDRNYAAALQIPVALPTPHPIPYAVYQVIPSSRIPLMCHDPGVECSLHASVWTKVDRIWGERSQILLEFFIQIERDDDGYVEELLDPFVWNKFHWQYGQINVGLLKDVDRIKSIKIGVQLGAPRGTILVDDFYLSIRANPI